MKTKVILFILFILQQTAFAKEAPDCSFLKENWKGYVHIDSPYGDSYAATGEVVSTMKFLLHIDSDQYKLNELQVQCENGNSTLTNAKTNLSGRVYKNYLHLTGYNNHTFLIVDLF